MKVNPPLTITEDKCRVRSLFLRPLPAMPSAVAKVIRRANKLLVNMIADDNATTAEFARQQLRRLLDDNGVHPSDLCLFPRAEENMASDLLDLIEDTEQMQRRAIGAEQAQEAAEAATAEALAREAETAIERDA